MPSPLPRQKRAVSPASVWSVALVVAAACSVFPDSPGSLNAAGGSSSSGGGTNPQGGSASATGGASASGGAGTSGANAGHGNDAGAPNEGGANNAGAAGSLGGTSSLGGSSSLGGTDNGGAGERGGNGNVGGTFNASGGSANTGGTGQGGTACSNVTLTATADSYVSEISNEQNINYGQDARLSVSGAAAARAHTVLAFDFSGVPSGDSLQSATLVLTLGVPVSEAHGLSLFALSQTFLENRVTWVRPTQNVKWATPGGDTAVQESAHANVGAGLQAGALVTFDVSTDVGGILQGVRPSNGWLVAATDGEPPLEFVSLQSAFPAERPRIELSLCR